MNNVRKILIKLFLLIVVVSILFQIVLAQENETKNSVFLIKDIIATYFKEILAIISPFITFVLGMRYQNHRIKKSNIREKAKRLDEGIMKDLKNHANEIKKRIDEKNYVSFIERTIFFERTIKATLEFNENEFADFLYDSGIFKSNDNKTALTYQKDEILKKHANIIIQNLENYRSEVSHLKGIIENLNEENVPPKFGENLRNLLKDDRLKEFLFKSYVVSISGSKNSNTSGNTWEIAITKQQYDDLQYIARSDPKSNDTSSIIQSSLGNVLYYLNNLVNEIEKLHDEWQNKLII